MKEDQITGHFDDLLGGASRWVYKNQRVLVTALFELIDQLEAKKK